MTQLFLSQDTICSSSHIVCGKAFRYQGLSPQKNFYLSGFPAKGPTIVILNNATIAAKL